MGSQMPFKDVQGDRDIRVPNAMKSTPHVPGSHGQLTPEADVCIFWSRISGVCSCHLTQHLPRLSRASVSVWFSVGQLPDPALFDGFRYAKLREQEGDSKMPYGATYDPLDKDLMHGTTQNILLDINLIRSLASEVFRCK